MFVRVASFENADLRRLRDENERRAQEGMMDMPAGMKGAMVIADEASGRHQFLTFFDSREAIAAAEARFEQMGDEIAEDVRGRRVSVDVYEVAFSMQMADAMADA